MNQTTFIAILVAALCFCSALAVAYTKHLSRQAYIKLSYSERAIDALDVQWSQLQIEESTFSEHGLVERIARDRLDMTYPGLDGSEMIAR